MNKKIIRKEFFEKRTTLSPKDIIHHSNIISEKLYEMNAYKNAKTIMSFVSFGYEVNTHHLIQEAISQGKSILVPITIPEPREMKVSLLKEFSELEIGFYNILTPKKEFIRLMDPETIDLILVPGLAFARDGYRIGYGGGYYDRFLSKLKGNPPKIALAFDLQITEKLPTDSYDIPVDIIITEKEIINCSGKEF